MRNAQSTSLGTSGKTSSLTRLKHCAVLTAFVGWALTGCTTITAPDETKALGEASDPLSSALQSMPDDLFDAQARADRANKIKDALNGVNVHYEQDCDAAAKSALDGYMATLRAATYDPKSGDSAYAKFRYLKPCELAGVQLPTLPAAKPIDDPAGNPYSVIGAGVPATNANADKARLDAVGKTLQAYVEQLSKLATGESYGKLADQRKAAYEAAGGFADALGAPFASPIAAVLLSIANGAAAAERNRATLDILTRMDALMPDYMERVGLASRLAIAETIYADSQAASDHALLLNMAISDQRLRTHPLDRATILLPLDERLQAENGRLLALRSEDPMRAARAFAAAHHALREIFANPRSQRLALFRGLKDLADAAGALNKAVADAKKAKDKTS